MICDTPIARSICVLRYFSDIFARSINNPYVKCYAAVQANKAETHMTGCAHTTSDNNSTRVSATSERAVSDASVNSTVYSGKRSLIGQIVQIDQN